MTDHPIEAQPAVAHGAERRAVPRRWESARSQDALDLIAEGVTQFGGFEQAGIVVVRGREVECVAVAGDRATRARFLGTRAPLAAALEALPDTEDHERPRFVWRDASTPGTAPPALPSLPSLPTEGPAPLWRPQHGLVVPLHDDARDLVGLLAVDRPRDGRRPGAAQLRFLEQYAVQALRAILAERDREELECRMEVARTTRRAVRRATTRLSLEAIVAECREALVGAFRASDVWLRLVEGFPTDPHLVLDPPPGSPMAPDALLRRLERRAWDDQQALVMTAGRPAPALLDDEEVALMRGVMAHYDIGSALLAPIGSGDECLGRLVLVRGVDDPPWREAEAESALDIGHDLGRAVLNARTYEREHELVQELQAVDAYTSRLIATVAHELRTPLTSVLGNLELLDDGVDPAQAAAVLARAHRGAQRLAALVDDLLLLSRVSDDLEPASAPVDLLAVTLEVRDLMAADARAHEQTLLVESPVAPVLVPGDRRELDRLVTNLISNALKYSPPGRTVTVSVSHEGDEVVWRCADEGIGISEDDRRHLFREFFRADNDSTQRQAGTGLGLSIVSRIVTRHHGSVEVDSEVGRGSTFTVRLPASAL